MLPTTIRRGLAWWRLPARPLRRWIASSKRSLHKLRAAGLAATIERGHFVAQALQEPDVRERLARQGLYPSGTTPKAFTTQIAREIDKMKGVAAFAKVSLD